MAELMDIPDDALRHLVEYLGPYSAVNFALTCRRAHKIVKSVNLYVDELRLKIGKSKCELSLDFYYSAPRLVWTFSNSESPRKKNRKSTRSANFLEDFKFCVEFLVELIRFPVSAVSVKGDFEGSEELFDTWRVLDQVDEISMDLVTWMDIDLTRYKDLERFSITGCVWFEPRHLKNTEIAESLIYTPNLGVGDANEIIKDWFESDNRKTKEIEIGINSATLIPNYDELLYGIEFKPYDSTRHQRVFRREHRLSVNCENGKDIVRKDGLVASVVYCGAVVHLNIWHDPFPDRTNPRN